MLRYLHIVWICFQYIPFDAWFVVKFHSRNCGQRLVCPKRSDGHGFENPCGFAGTGLTGTGVGHQIVTCDIPVPVWAGDGL